MTEKNQYFTCKISFSKALIFLYFGQFDFKLPVPSTKINYYTCNLSFSLAYKYRHMEQ